MNLFVKRFKSEYVRFSHNNDDRSIPPQAENEVNFARPGWLVLLALLIGSIIAIAVGKFGILTSLAVLGLIILVATLAKPDLGFYLFLFAIYINLSSVLVTNYALPSTARLMVSIMGGVILVRRIIFKDEYQGWIFPTILLGLYAFLGMLSLVYASNYAVANEALIAYLKDALIGIIIVLLAQRPSSLKIAVWAILTAGLFMATISVIQQFTGTFNNWYWGFARTDLNITYGNRLSGPIGDPNFFAQIMVVLVPIAIDRIWNEKNGVLKGLAAWILIATLLTVVYTYSRGGFLALVAAFIIMALLRPHRLSFVLLGLAVLTITFQFIPSNYKDRISSIFNISPNSRTGGYVDASVQGRTSENLVAWNMFRNNPIVGVGVGNYNIYYQQYSRQLGLDSRLSDRSAHNLYLEVAAERGVLGLIVFGCIIILTLRQAFGTSNKFKQLGNKDFADLAAALGVSFIAYLITAIFLHDAYPRFFWVLVGICWALPQSVQYFSVQSKIKAIHP